MRIDFPHPHPVLGAVAERFVAASYPRRADMILRAIGGQSHKEGWILRNGRLVPSAGAVYWASDLNALAAAERLVGLRNSRYVVLGDGMGCRIFAGDAKAIYLRLTAATERDGRGLAIVAHACLRPHDIGRALTSEAERLIATLTLKL